MTVYEPNTDVRPTGEEASEFIAPSYEPPTAPGAGGDTLLSLTERLEHDQRLDGAIDPLHTLAQRVAEGDRGRFLRGEWLGHALHPLLTDIPLGCWTSAGLLDLVGGKRSHKAAQRLMALGLLSALPTAAAGLAEYSTMEHKPTQRVASAHAMLNTAVLAFYFSSWRARRRGHHLRGVSWGMAGGATAIASGYLGGHLSFARRVGTGERPER